MTVPLHDLLDRVHQAGASVSANGDKLRVETTAPLSDELVSELREAKPALLQHLRGDGWDATNWWALHQERIAIAEHDGGLSGIEAERQAFEDCIAFWLHRNPPPASGPDRCTHCGKPLGRAGEDAIPTLTGDGGHLWLHHQCWDGWMARRRVEAVKALAGVGIERKAP